MKLICNFLHERTMCVLCVFYVFLVVVIGGIFYLCFREKLSENHLCFDIVIYELYLCVGFTVTPMAVLSSGFLSQIRPVNPGRIFCNPTLKYAYNVLAVGVVRIINDKLN